MESQKGAANVDTGPGLQTGQGGTTSSGVAVGICSATVADGAMQLGTTVA